MNFLFSLFLICFLLSPFTDPVYELLIGSETNYTVYNTTSVITNITCSYSSLYSCTYYTTDSTNCSSYGGVAIFSCRESMFECILPINDIFPVRCYH